MKRIVNVVLAVLLLAMSTAVFAEGQQDSDVYRVAVSLPPANNSWQARMYSSIIEEAAKDTDEFVFDVKNAVDDADQLNMLQTFRDGGYDLIMCLPGNGTLMTPICEEIYDSGTKLVIIDRPIDSDKYTALIAGDNYGCGVNAAKYFGEQLDGKGDIVVLHSYIGSPIDLQRYSGFADTLKKDYPGINILVEGDGEFNQEAGLKATSNVLPAYPQIDAVYTHDDETAIGAITAIENSGRDDIKFVIGMGGAKSAYKMLQNNHYLFTASMSYFPTMGGDAVVIAKSILRGEDFEKNTIAPTYIVTNDNVDQFLGNAY